MKYISEIKETTWNSTENMEDYVKIEKIGEGMLFDI